jgi:sugar lactone lactonase YvrE
VAAAANRSGSKAGFALVAVVALLALLAVTAAVLNRRTALQAGMSANQAWAVRCHFGERAVSETAVWALLRNPFWTTNTALFPFAGTNYALAASRGAAASLDDLVLVTAQAPGAGEAMRTVYRHYVRPLAGAGGGFAGDGGPAAGALLNTPFAAAADSRGNLYISDWGNSCIRMVDATGTIWTVAGTPLTPGTTGDGGLAREALFSEVRGVFVDRASNLYVAERDNHAIRRVGTNGILTTLAGTVGTNGFAGDGGPATAARLNGPRWATADTNGNFYVADTDNNRIRRVNAAGTIQTIAGGNAGFSGDGGPATAARLNRPRCVLVDAAGRILVADTDNHCVRMIDTAGIITTLAGIGTRGGYTGDGVAATATRLNHPFGLALDGAGNLYIADVDNARIRAVSARDGIMHTVAGTGTSGYNGNDLPAATTRLRMPYGVTTVADATGLRIHICDSENNRVRTLALKVAPLLY